MVTRWLLSSAGVVLLLLMASCVSQTVPSERTSDSRQLAPPANNVSLSDNEHFTFAAVGDLHIGSRDTSRLQRIMTAATAEGDAFLILLGDIVDKGDHDDFVAVQQALHDGGFDGKVFPMLGNHDIFNGGWSEYKAIFGPNYYRFTVGNSTFFAMDTADGTLGAEQMDWLESELKKPLTTNTFFLSHYLPVIPGQRTYLKLADQNEALHLMKLALNHGVAAWLGGHYHSYIQEQIDGVLYVVAGGGGERRMAPVSDYFFVQVKVDGSSVSAQMNKVD